MDDNEPDFTWAERTFLTAVFEEDRERAVTAIKWLPKGQGLMNTAGARPLTFAACAKMLGWGGAAAEAVARLFPPEDGDARTNVAKTAAEFARACLGFAAGAILRDDLWEAETWIVRYTLIPPQQALQGVAAALCDRLIGDVADLEIILAQAYPWADWHPAAQLPSKQQIEGVLGEKHVVVGMAARLVWFCTINGDGDLAAAVVESAVRRGAWPTWHALVSNPLLDEAVIRSGPDSGAYRFFAKTLGLP